MPIYVSSRRPRRKLALGLALMPLLLTAAMPAGLAEGPQPLQGTAAAQEPPDAAPLPPVDAAVVAQEEPTVAAASSASADTAEAEGAPPPARAEGALALPSGGEIRYRATAETLPIREASGRTADVFLVSYVADAAAAARSAEARPVTFLFNGGPGAASAFLMLGAAGPKALVTNDDGTVPRPPARLADNPASWLAFTDLVFVDPVGTGFSRIAPAEKESGSDSKPPFFSVRGDVDALSEVVRLWLTRNGRWSSPKFLAGESYGGFRAVMMAEALQREAGVDINGLVLISPALEFSLLYPGEHDLLPWALRLPSMAAAAQAQGRAPAVDAAVVERFALTDYLVWLAAPVSSDPAAPPADALRRLAVLTGLPEKLVRRYDGRIPRDAFAKELLRGSGRVISLYDASVTVPDPDPGASELGPDPMLDGLVAPYATAFNAYVRGELGYESDHPYRLLNREISRRWDWDDAHGGGGRGGHDKAGAMDALESLMALNPALRVLAVHGVHDLVIPYFTTEWLFGQMRLPEPIRANARLEVYEGGHMPYMRPEMRRRLMEDVRALYEDALAGA